MKRREGGRERIVRYESPHRCRRLATKACPWGSNRLMLVAVQFPKVSSSLLLQPQIPAFDLTVGSF